MTSFSILQALFIGWKKLNLAAKSQIGLCYLPDLQNVPQRRATALQSCWPESINLLSWKTLSMGRVSISLLTNVPQLYHSGSSFEKFLQAKYSILTFAQIIEKELTRIHRFHIHAQAELCNNCVFYKVSLLILRSAWRLSSAIFRWHVHLIFWDKLQKWKVWMSELARDFLVVPIHSLNVHLILRCRLLELSPVSLSP